MLIYILLTIFPAGWSATRITNEQSEHCFRSTLNKYQTGRSGASVVYFWTASNRWGLCWLFCRDFRDVHRLFGFPPLNIFGAIKYLFFRYINYTHIKNHEKKTIAQLYRKKEKYIFTQTVQLVYEPWEPQWRF